MGDHWELSDLQRTMLVQEEIADRPMYNMPWSFRLTGALDPGVLAESLALAAQRHPVLRARFDADRAWPEPEPVVLTRVHGTPSWGESGRLAEVVEPLWQEPFQLEQEAPARFQLVSLAPDDHVLSMCVHHVAGDSWSVALLLREVAEAYATLAHGRTWPAAGSPAPNYFEYAATERHRQGDTTWWRNRLLGIEPARPPRTDPTSHDERGAVCRAALDLDATQTRRLRTTAAALRVSPVTVLLAALSATTATGGDERTAVTGLVAGLRDEVQTQEMVGPLINILPVRVTWRADSTPQAVLEHHRDAVAETLAHKDTPSSAILASRPFRGAGAVNRLYLHVLNVDTEQPRLSLPGIFALPRPLPLRWAIFPAVWEFSWQPQGNITGTLIASLDDFTPSQAEALASTFRSRLSELT
jgi:hypothetical protein